MPLVVIAGATGTGKTALAIQLAKTFDGEIVAADSRTVYKGMDIGTAKPTAAERQGIPHYGIDVVEPNEPFNAYDFQQLAYRAIDDIALRGKLPIIVGGTGLYIDAVLYSFQFRAPASPDVRAELDNLSVETLQERVLAAGLSLPASATNRRHLTRLLESGPAPQQARKLRNNTLVLGLTLPQEVLRERITARVEQMIEAGLVDEVRSLEQQYGDREALQAPGYKAMRAYLSGEIDHAEAKRQFVAADLALAKRQGTWFKRSTDIHWLDFAYREQQAHDLVEQFYTV